MATPAPSPPSPSHLPPPSTQLRAPCAVNNPWGELTAAGGLSGFEPNVGARRGTDLWRGPARMSLRSLWAHGSLENVLMSCLALPRNSY